MNDPEYYRRRIDQARSNAEKAVTPSIRQIHLELASHYAARLAEAEQLVGLWEKFGGARVR